MLALAVGSAACSTTYQPKRADHIYLVVDSSKLALRKNGQTVAEDGPFSVLFSCDQAASVTAGSAQHDIKAGYDLQAITAVLHLLVGPGSILAVVLAAQAQQHLDHGHAALIDALNRHNDAAACKSEG
jgi:hypothetical protein